MRAFLQLPNGTAIPLTSIGAARFGPTGVVTIETERPEVRLMLRGHAGDIAAELYRLAEEIKGKTVAEVSARVLSITPEEVVLYFEQSPVLREMADDVRTVLLGKGSKSGSSGSQFDRDWAAVRAARLVNPTKADIAEALTGQRTYGGAVYQRVTAVFDAYYATTTTTETSTIPQKVA